MEERKFCCLGTVEINEAKRLRALMEGKGVQLELATEPSSCSSGGCQVTVKVFCLEKDIPKVQELLQAENTKAFSGHAIKPEMFEATYDPRQKEAICPACGTKFDTSLSECPDCGLGFAI